MTYSVSSSQLLCAGMSCKRSPSFAFSYMNTVTRYIKRGCVSGLFSLRSASCLKMCPIHCRRRARIQLTRSKVLVSLLASSLIAFTPTSPSLLSRSHPTTCIFSPTFPSPSLSLTLTSTPLSPRSHSYLTLTLPLILTSPSLSPLPHSNIISPCSTIYTSDYLVLLSPRCPCTPPQP